MTRGRLWKRCPPLALGLGVALALPLRLATATTPDTLPDEAAIRAGADLWFDEHIAPWLHASHTETPGSLLGTAAPAPKNPLSARASGRLPDRLGLVSDGIAPRPGD